VRDLLAQLRARLAGAPILMYHGVGAPAAHGEARYTVSGAALGAHLAALADAGLRPVGLPALLGGARGVCLSFDDGEASVARLAAPLLAAAGAVGVAYVTSGFLGTPGYLDAAALRTLAAAGWTVGAHGRTHRFLSDLPAGDLADELAGARRDLEDVLGAPVRHLSLPGGRGGARVTAAARAAGYVSVATSAPGLNRRLTPLGLQRLIVQQADRPARVAALARGHLPTLLPEVAQVAALGAAKRLLGNARYEGLRARVLDLVRRR
jgi:peptidoglycan/xylan/chitin deacetylase (PgdA/CDA1 family)